MNTLPVPYTNSWQISNDSNSTDQNYIIQSWCSLTIYKHSENFAQKTINIVWLSWQKWIKIVWKFSRPMWNSSTNISQTELSVRHSLDPPFIVEFLELSKHLPVRLSVGGVAAAARLTDRPGNVERLVWTYVIGRYILLWKEQIHIWILLETSKENLKMKFFFTKIVIFICTGVMTKTLWKVLRWANKNLWTFEKYITFTFTDTIILSKESDVYCIRFIIQKYKHGCIFHSKIICIKFSF